MENKTVQKSAAAAPKNKENVAKFRLKGFCERLCECLDLLGYSPEMIRYRSETNNRLDEIYNSKPFPANHITTGGKAEGTALYFESDIDHIYAEKEIACVEPGLSCFSRTVLHLDRLGCSQGYTRVKLVHIRESDSNLSNYLVSEQNNTYIGNNYSIFHKNDHKIDINGMRIIKQDKSGPAAPYGNTSIKYDFVFGFECICPDLIEKWINRQRKHGWPDPGLIKHISALEGHVVPVANKGSKFPQTEWRICFTKAELMQMHSLNEFQTKLYILLKLIAKSVLKPLCSEMSSYIMKNIIFWIMETSPGDEFSQECLIDRLIDSLIYLKDCLRSNVLKSYMIDDRNLFEGRITGAEKELLIKKIDELVSEKENMLQHCDKVRVAMNKLMESPEEFSKETDRRNKIEKLVYKKNVIFKETANPNQSLEVFQDRLSRNEVCIQYEKDLHMLVIPDNIDITEESQSFEEVYRERLASILS